MSVKLLIPEFKGIHSIAAAEFNKLCKAVTGSELEVVTEDDNTSDLVILGSDTSHRYVHELVMQGLIEFPKVRIMSDEYEFIPLKKDGRKMEILAAGRPRALLYAVYRFFELRASCRYFWDGDITPAKKEIDFFDLAKYERPHFKYRGLAYCPHRSLKRFQPEHWDYDDWVKEIDWVLKKRFNTIWIRIGIEDIFRKAFPDIVQDHGYECPGAPECSYDDRRLFWPLEYKAKLRKMVLDYAYARDLFHPEEAGAFTHWDTFTPQDFIDKVKPSLLCNATAVNLDTRHLHWDIREDLNLDNYFKVTQASIDNCGRPWIFYVRGISERSCFSEHKQNMKFKIYCYKRIITKIRTEYPFAEIWFHNWDLMCNQWKPEDVLELLELINDDPNIHMLSFTNDVEAGMNSVTEWGVPHTFPWLLAFFIANMPESELRGGYDLIENRLAIARKDPMCHGLLLWPEASHVDHFLYEYISRNGWEPDHIKADSLVDTFCEDRYTEQVPEMKKLWHDALSIFRRRRKIYRDPANGISGFTITHQLNCSYIFDEMDMVRARNCFINYREAIKKAPGIFQQLAHLAAGNPGEMLDRDIRDLAKTTTLSLFEYLSAGTLILMEFWRNEQQEEYRNYAEQALEMRTGLLELFYLLLASSRENSLYDSLIQLGANPAHESNPDFEAVLKGNANNYYCRGNIAELVQYCYIPEAEVYCSWVRDGLRNGVQGRWKRPKYFETKSEEIQNRFMSTPLKEMKPDDAKAKAQLPDTLERLSGYAVKINELGQKINGPIL